MGLRNMFREMDADKNGVISIAELNEALNSKGLPEAQAKVVSVCAWLLLHLNWDCVLWGQLVRAAVLLRAHWATVPPTADNLDIVFRSS